MKLSNSVSGAIRTFTYFMSSGTHYMISDLDYISLYGKEPSAIEQVYAIFINVLETDEDGNVTNFKYAQKRATDYLRMYINRERVEPEYEQWEIDLH